MKVEWQLIERATLDSFAIANDLTLVIREFVYDGDIRFSVQFKNVQIKDGHFLKNRPGEAATFRDAITMYALQISLQMLVYTDPATNATKTLQVPRLASRAIIDLDVPSILRRKRPC